VCGWGDEISESVGSIGGVVYWFSIGTGLIIVAAKMKHSYWEDETDSSNFSLAARCMGYHILLTANSAMRNGDINHQIMSA